MRYREKGGGEGAKTDEETNSRRGSKSETTELHCLYKMCISKFEDGGMEGIEGSLMALRGGRVDIWIEWGEVERGKIPE